jgi:hypothetical protein
MANNKIDKVFPNMDWNRVSTTLQKSGKIRLAEFANTYGVSIPTMRKILERKYGSSLQFRRGRTGGVFPTKDFPFSSTGTSRVTYSDSDASSVVPVTEIDEETEAIVDSILGVEA